MALSVDRDTDHVEHHVMVAQDMSAIPGMRRVHDLPIWTLSSGQIGLTAHLDLDNFDDWDRILRAARACLDQRHGIRHVTLQAELKPTHTKEPI
jgi:cobalt-zinc-cadmium efflux system protein